MSYALATLWYERQRFLPGVLAVAFSALLIALQCGLLLGLFSITSLPIDETRADVWVGHPKVLSVDLGKGIPAEWLGFLSMDEVVQSEIYLQGFAYWDKPTGGSELCLVIGSRLGENALGSVKNLTEDHRAALTELGAVVVDESEFDRLGITGVGAYSEINGKRVRVVGTVRGYKSLAGPYVFCSVDTAKRVMRMPDQATFFLAKTRTKEDAPTVVARLNEMKAHGRERFSAATAEDFSFHSRWHWLTKTKAGIALGFAAALGLLVGAVVTSQTLYAATAASMKEYAVLRAMGIPRWRMAAMVLSQSFWIGTAGVALALPTVFALAHLANEIGAKVLLPWQLLAFAVAVTMTMALLSGMTALRSLRMIEPVNLLR
jgi:putative ABC transport system permease protein